MSKALAWTLGAIAVMVGALFFAYKKTTKAGLVAGGGAPALQAAKGQAITPPGSLPPAQNATAQTISAFGGLLASATPLVKGIFDSNSSV